MNMMRKYSLIPLLIGILCCLSCSGCVMRRTPQEQIDTKVVSTLNCKYEDDPLSSIWIFDVNQDNQIVKMTLQTEISKYDIEKTYPDASEEEIKEVFTEYAEKQKNDYEYITQKYDKKWMDITYHIDEEDMEIQVIYVFDVSYEGLNYELEDGIFKDFGLDVLWNDKKQGFYYDEDAINNELFSDLGICANVEEDDYKIKEYPKKSTEDDNEDDEEDSDVYSSHNKSPSDSLTPDEIQDLFSSSEEKDEDKDGQSSVNLSKDEDKDKAGTSSSNTDKTEKPDVNDVNENVSIFDK